jgi:TRAP-type mannitol/chloroaromatic compound transport system permease small subunit
VNLFYTIYAVVPETKISRTDKNIMSKLSRFVKFIDTVNDFIGRCVSFLIFPIIVVILYEVVMRYFLKLSQDWVPETSQYLFGALFLLGGGYVLLHNGHVKLDILYDRLSARTKALLDICTFVLLLMYGVVLIWKGGLTAWDSLMTLERSQSGWSPLMFPIRFGIPIGAALLVLQGIVKFIRDIVIVTKGKSNEC